MANNKTLLKAIERCDKRIAKAKAKRKWSRSILDRDKAAETIKEQESKKLRLQQQIKLNSVLKLGK